MSEYAFAYELFFRVLLVISFLIVLMLGYLIYESRIFARNFQASIKNAVVAMGVNTQQMIRESHKETREMHRDTREFLKDLDTRSVAILERIEKDELD